MASTIIPPFIVRLPSITHTGEFQYEPTIETGDVTLRVDAGVRANVSVAPVVDGYDVMVYVDDAELPLGWNTVSVDFIDIAGNEWKPVHISLFSDLFSVADPLMKQVPGDYPSGTAGHVLGRLGQRAVSVTTFNPERVTLSLWYGDSYQAVDGRALDFLSIYWPALAGASIEFTCEGVTLPMSLVNAGPTQVVRLELTEQQVIDFGRGNYAYEIDADLVSGNHVTLVSGRMSIV